MLRYAQHMERSGKPVKEPSLNRPVRAIVRAKEGTRALNVTTNIIPFRKTLAVLTHPVAVFIWFQFVWVCLTVLWVLWYVDRLDNLSQLQKMGSQMIAGNASVWDLVSGLVLLTAMLIGSIWLFVIGQKRTADFKQQQIFVSSVTHELRSPLANLQLTFETLKKRTLPDDIKAQLLDNGEKDTERLLRLVNQILLSARLDKGIEKFDEKSESIELNSLIDQAIERAKVIDPDAPNRIEIDCPGSMRVHAPRSALLLLLANLVENAVKYSPGGELISICAALDGPDHVKISIKDRGFGLEKHELRKIFRMFYRGTIANTKAIKGTGVGLFIVKTVSKLLNANIWAESEGRGLGSTFFLRLPLTKKDKIKSRV